MKDFFFVRLYLASTALRFVTPTPCHADASSRTEHVYFHPQNNHADMWIIGISWTTIMLFTRDTALSLVALAIAAPRFVAALDPDICASFNTGNTAKCKLYP